MQMNSGIHLRGHHTRQTLPIQRIDHAIIEHTSRMNHRGQRPLPGTPAITRSKSSLHETSQATIPPHNQAPRAPPAAPPHPPRPDHHDSKAKDDEQPCSPARCRASSAPRPPVPPVISTVPQNQRASARSPPPLHPDAQSEGHRERRPRKLRLRARQRVTQRLPEASLCRYQADRSDQGAPNTRS